ncbi:serine/threonine-protein kinase [Nonomuraea longicatena]|uniref:Protein kinase domain-containing protein n=1 Tax=Nonomuraea longicatena TaxID=83682 RepID=A0ABN1QP96_9ACTN
MGTYQLDGRLGQGGQGVVFRGRTPTGAQVAIKLLHGSVAADPEVRRRFLAEVDAVRRVAPFCTAQVLDASLDGDRPYLVSEYVDGVSLREHVVADGPRTGGSLDRIAIGTATALGAIHRAGVVHRDFKPGNVLLGLDGPRVIDFGVSRLMDSTVTTGQIPVGTPAYLAPERIEGQQAGPAADVYAWALTVAYTANGRQAFTAETYQEVLARILYGKPDLGSLSGRLLEIVQACLVADPVARPDAEAVLRFLLAGDAGGDVLTSGAMAALGADPKPAASERTVPFQAVSVRTASGRAAAVQTTSFPALSDRFSQLVPEEAGADQGEADQTVTGGRRGGRAWAWASAGVVLVAALGGLGWWFLQPPGLAGVWTGSADHVTAGRVFPVEIRIPQDGTGSMLWGADLKCSASLAPTEAAWVFQLESVKGKECHPGTLHFLPQNTNDKAGFNVVRKGQDAVTYSGAVSRLS